MDIGRRVKTARKRAQLSQDALARLAGISVSAVAQIEQGERTDPHYSTLRKLAEGLGMSVGELLEDYPKVEAPTSSPEKEVDEERRVAELERWIEYIERRSQAWEQQAATEENPFFANPKIAVQWESEVSKEVLEISEAAEKAARDFMEENIDGATAAQELQKLEDAYKQLWKASRLVTSRANKVVTGAGREALKKAAEDREKAFEAFQEFLNLEGAGRS